MVYTITLNPALDYYLSFPNKLSNHQTTNDFKFIPGGKGINAAHLLKNLETKNQAIIVTGGDVGKKLINLCEKQKINVKNIKSAHTTRINVKSHFGNQVIEQNTVGNKIDGKKINHKIMKYLKKKLKKDDIVMIMGSLPIGYSEKDLENLVTFLQSKKINLVFDLPQKYLLKIISARPKIIKPNLKELATIFQTKITTNSKIIHYGQKLLDLGAQSVIVSLDQNGAYYLDKKQVIKINPIKVNVINSSGAGDSMLAGFVHGIINNYNLNETLKLATGAGTASVASIGIGTKQKILFYKKKVEMEVL